MMIRRGKWLFLYTLFLADALVAGVGTWQTYTSMREVRDVVRVGTVHWAASGGGLFSWSGGSTFQEFSNAEGLLTNDLTAVGADPDGNIWAGASNGAIQVLSGDGSWRYVLDILQSNQTSKRVNRLTMQGDTALICTEFGLSMFNTKDFLFGDTYTQFGSLTDGRVAVTDAVIYNDSLWAAVSDGQSIHRVAVSDLGNPNRLPPESWSLLSVWTSGTKPTKLRIFANRLYVGTSSGLYYRSGGFWISVPELAGKEILACDASENTLAVCTATEVFLIAPDNTVIQLPDLDVTATSVALSQADQPIIGSNGSGLQVYEVVWTTYVPNGPASNQFLSVAVDPGGKVWGASGISGNGKGIYRFDGSSWKSFTKDDNGLPTNDYYRVSVGCNGSVWASSWGEGVIEFFEGVDSVRADRIFSTNVGLVGLAGDTDYVVITNVVCDQLGNEWMSVNAAANAKIIAVRQADGATWSTVPLKVSTSQVSTLFYNIPLDRTLAVDAFGNIWGGSRNITYKGVFGLNNRGAIEDSAYVLLTEQDGLPSSEITTVVVDKDNDIWVGTDKGIGIILDPLDPRGVGGIAPYKPLNGIVVNTIAIDPLNQKWVGTPDGVVVLTSDGVQQLASYTVENTGGKLVDNDVKSIAIDNASGTVYFGTAVGLSSLTTDAAQPLAEFDKLRISPNPYLAPASTPLLIDGLVENSIVKILTIDGRLIREIFSSGGRVGFWDGRDAEGTTVASGVYVVVAYSSDGSKVVTGKVAVVRK
jgi:ligand-binding sensor domain-containing protein